jgi:hypothetical protein
MLPDGAGSACLLTACSLIHSRSSHKTEACGWTIAAQPAFEIGAVGLTFPMQAWAEVAHLRHCSAFRDLLTGERTNL